MSRMLLIAPSVVYVIALAWLLWRVLRRRLTPTVRTEALGDKPFGIVMVTVTLVATVIGPADTLALADQGRIYGLFFAIFPLFAALQHFVTGTFFADKINLEARECVTIGEIMRRYYNRSAQVLTGIIITLQALAFTGILCLAAGQVLQAFFQIPIGYGIIGSAVFVGIYTTFGGMNAVVYTDRIQFAVQVLLGAIAVGAALVLVTNSTPTTQPLTWWRPDYKEYDANKIIGTAIAYFLGEALLPVYAVRSLISETPSSAKRAFKVTSFVIAIWYLAMSFVGVAAQRIIGSPTHTNLALVDVVASAFSHPAIRAVAVGLVLAGLLGIIHSTLDSILNAGAVSLTRDVIAVAFPLTDKEQRGYIHGSAVLIAVFGTLFSVAATNLIDALLIGYAVWVPTMVFPLGYALIRKTSVRWRTSAVIGLVAGTAGYFIGDAIEIPWFPAILCGLMANAIAFLAAERFAPVRRVA